MKFMEKNKAWVMFVITTVILNACKDLSLSCVATCSPRKPRVVDGHTKIKYKNMIDMRIKVIFEVQYLSLQGIDTILCLANFLLLDISTSNRMLQNAKSAKGNTAPSAIHNAQYDFLKTWFW